MTTFIKMSLTTILAAALSAAPQPQKDASGGKKTRFIVAASIGLPEAKKDDDKPYMFSSIVSADFDAEGNIYVLDWREACVKIFNPGGLFRSRFLSPGQGPEEVQNPLRLKVSPDGKRILVLHQNGFQIKEFDASENLVRTHPLPKQMYGWFNLLDGHHLLFVDGLPYGEKTFANLKVYSLSEKKFEKEIGLTNFDYFTGYQRFVVRNGVVWTCPGDLMDVVAYDLGSGTRQKTLHLPEKYRPSQVVRWRENIQKIRVWNYAQPFACAGDIYVLVTRQEFTPEPQDLFDRPLGRTTTLYRLDGERLVRAPDLPAFDFYPEFLSAGGKRVLISSSPYDLYPQLMILELR